MRYKLHGIYFFHKPILFSESMYNSFESYTVFSCIRHNIYNYIFIVFWESAERVDSIKIYHKNDK